MTPLHVVGAAVSLALLLYLSIALLWPEKFS
jgi:K+-transporting ATPase KdpF subunit